MLNKIPFSFVLRLILNTIKDNILVSFQGTFDVNGLSFDVDASAFPSGDYKIRGSLMTAGKEAACVEIIITIS